MKYGIIIAISEEEMKRYIGSSLSFGPDYVSNIVKKEVLTSKGLLSNTDDIECKLWEDIMTDTYYFRLRSDTHFPGLYVTATGNSYLIESYVFS